MSEVHAVEQELIDATNFVPEKKYRKRQDFLGALMRAVCDLPNEDYDRLTDAAAEWNEKAVEAFKNNEPLPDFANGAGHVSSQHPVEEDENSEIDTVATPDSHEDEGLGGEATETEKEKPAKKKPGRPKGKSTKVKVAKAPRNPSNKEPRGKNEWGVAANSYSDTVCRMLAQEGGTTMKDIIEATGHARYNVVNRLQKHGYKIVKNGQNIRMLP